MQQRSLKALWFLLLFQNWVKLTLCLCSQIKTRKRLECVKNDARISVTKMEEKHHPSFIQTLTR